MKTITKTIKITALAIALFMVGVSIVQATSDADLGVTVSCSGYNCVATSKFNNDTINYQKNGAKIGPFPKAGEVRLYFQILSGASGSMSGKVQVKLTKGSTYKTITIQESEQMIDTKLMVKQGDYVYVKTTDVGDGLAVGWHAPYNGDQCGSGFTLPRTGGVRGGYYPIIDASSQMSWAREAGEPIVQDMCWADWPEWEGDWDFEDYFMTFSYVPEVIVYPTVDLKVNGSDSTIYLQEPADYTLSWISTNAKTCLASNAWSGSKSLNGSQSVNNKPQGTYTYTITCRNGSQSATDTVQVVVNPIIIPNTYVQIQKTSREVNATSTVFIEDLYTYPGKEVEFSLVATVSGNTPAGNVIVRDILPEGLTYINGSTRINGAVTGDGVVSGGISLGQINPGQSKTVTFKGLVRDNVYFSQQVTKLINTAIADSGTGNSNSDTSNVWVVKTGRVLGATDVDTGPADMLMAGAYSSVVSMFMAGLQTMRKAYWKKQIMLARAK